MNQQLHVWVAGQVTHRRDAGALQSRSTQVKGPSRLLANFREEGLYPGNVQQEQSGFSAVREIYICNGTLYSSRGPYLLILAVKQYSTPWLSTCT